MIAGFKCRDGIASFLDNANAFMAKNATRFTGRHVAFQNMQISAADRGFENTDDGVRIFLNFRFGPLFKSLLSWTTINKGFHFNLHNVSRMVLL